MPNAELPPERLLRSRVTVPEHVVSRSFDAETVLLNLESGHYHGLNVTGGRMLELLRETGSPQRTAETVAQEFGREVDEVTEHLVALCTALAERGLIHIDDIDS